MDSLDNYPTYQGYLYFCSRTTQKEDLFDFFRRSSTKIGLGTATTVISAGAGNGRFDSRLIKESMPMLKYYTGFDHHVESFKSLQRHLEDVKTLQRTNLLLCPLKKFVCPSKVDIVLMIHILYYFQDIVDTIARGLSWLKPDGKLLIVVDNFVESISNHLSEKPTLLTSDIEAAFQEMRLDYEEYTIDHTFRAVGCDARIVDFALHRKATNVEVIRILQEINTMTDPLTGLLHHASHVYVVGKKQNREKLLINY